MQVGASPDKVVQAANVHLGGIFDGDCEVPFSIVCILALHLHVHICMGLPAAHL